MFDIGFPELFIVAVIGMLVIGPERLPVVARTVGRTLGQVKRTVRNFQRKLEDEVGVDDWQRPVRGKAPPGTPPSDEVEPPLNPQPASRTRPADRDTSEDDPT